jgi:hypothetical protein
MFMTDQNCVQITDTPGLLALARDARRRNSNRQANIELLERAIDPDGTHVLVFQMMHNGEEWRTQWLVKAWDTMEPITLWLDVAEGVFDAAVRREMKPVEKQA